MNRSRMGIAAVVLGTLTATAAAQAQSVAFFPNVSSFPNGVTLSATPAVSYDGRYVRLGMMPQFTALEGFTTYQVPAAVSGGGGGGLGGGGVGAVLGFAGMNGPVAGPGMGSAASPNVGVGPGMENGRAVRGAASASGDFEDQTWPQAIPARRAPRRLVAKATGNRPPRTVRPAPVKSPAPAPIKVKRTR